MHVRDLDIPASVAFNFSFSLKLKKTNIFSESERGTKGQEGGGAVGGRERREKGRSKKALERD